MLFRRTTLAVAFMALLAMPAQAQSGSDLYQQALRKERTGTDLPGAIALYQRVAAGKDRQLGARALIRIGETYEKMGRQEALQAYRRVLRDFADQTDPARTARQRLAALEPPIAVKSATGLAVKLLWEGPRIDIEGRPTPDGRYLTFVDWYDTGELALRDLVTGEKKLLTKDGDGDDVYPLLSSISQDGGRVAFFWTPPNQYYWQPQLRVVNIDGTGERVLIENADREIDYLEPHDWTPDGKHVLVSFRMKNGTNHVGLVSLQDGSIRIVTRTGPRRTMRAALTADGKWVAYDLVPDTTMRQRDIFISAADGSSEMRIEHPANDLHPIFSPKGDYLLFSSDRDGSVGLWGMRFVDGKTQGEPLLIKGNLAHGFYPMGFAGDALFYAQETGGGDIFTVDFDVANPRVTGTPKKLIEQYQGYNTAGYWSADGKTFVYGSRRLNISLGQWARTYLRDMTTGQERELETAPAIHKWFARPRPSPDGRYVVVLGDLQNKRGVYLIDTRNGERRALASFGDNGEYAAGNAAWSHNGSSVYFGARKAGGDTARIMVVRHDIATGRETEVVTGIDRNVTGTIRMLVTVSPDEQSVAYAGFDKERNFRIYVAPMGGGAHRELTTVKPPHSIDAYGQGGLTWTPDGKYILFAQAVKSDRHDDVELFAVPVTGGAPRSTGFVMPSLRHISFAPDGKRITFTAGPIEYKEVWIMENLMPRLKGK